MAPADGATGATHLKRVGRRRVLETIRRVGKIARIDIAQETGLSPATVTAATSDLMNAGLIEEVAQDLGGTVKRGRPRVLLRLRAKAHLVAGVKIAHRRASVLIADFEGKEIASADTDLPSARMTADGLMQEIARAVAAACACAGIASADLSGVGVALAGQIDATSNFVHWSSSLTDRNVDFGTDPAEGAPWPVFFDNDANLVAKAEHLMGEGRGVDNFLVVTVEHGVGMGIVIDGKIYRGVHGCGAEFGHTKVALDGALCQCGQTGCLEAYLGDYAVLRAAGLTPAMDAPADIGLVQKAALAGDARAQDALTRASDMFALGMANMINLFDPELIILSGAQTCFDHLHSPKVTEKIQNSVLRIDAPLPDIRVHQWGDLMWARGAATFAIEQISLRTIQTMAQNAA
ncbi:ROK family transcriptional regulator [Aliishimia ponticola]|uniref:ROK family transcriptional regulator n=1 Tax=Aliishimia ponticola TaxID=2499833 RepID=A0A4S4NJZ3_9RHOB|nr:ROK family transcriptional regulator [Aliishimia ponticola]THH38591.1 ROK family transcriptional regulator [Aliishimia ponticola]